MTDIRVLRLGIDSRGAEQGSRRVKRSLDDIKKGGREAAGGIDQVETRLSSLKKVAITVAAVLATVGVSLSLTGTVREFGSFEQGLIAVGKTTDIAGTQLDALGVSVQGLARDVPTVTTELLEISQAAGQLGVSGTGNILRFTETVGKLGLASNLAGEEAATSLARILTVTGTSISEVDRLGSVIVRLGNNFAATEREIADVATRVARAASLFDASVADVAGISAALKSVGVEAEEGGSQVSVAFQQINTALRQGGDELKALTEITGQTGEQLRAAFGNDPITVFTSFVEGLGRIKAEGGDVGAALDELGLEGIRAVQVFGPLASRFDVLADALSQASDEFEANTALNKEAAVAAQAFNSQMTLVGSAVDEAAVEFGRGLAPAILDATGKFREFTLEAVDSGRVADVAGDIGAAFSLVANNLDLVAVAAIAFTGRALGPMLISVKAGEVGLLQMAAAGVQAEIASFKAAKAQAVLATANLNVAKSGLAVAGLIGTSDRLTVATAAARDAQIAHAAALRATSIAGIAAQRAMSLLRGTMALLGGPIGVALTLAGGLAILATRHDSAAAAADTHKTRLDALSAQIDRTKTDARELADVLQESIDREILLAERELDRLVTAREAAMDLVATPPASTSIFGEADLPQSAETELASRQVTKLTENIDSLALSLDRLKDRSSVQITSTGGTTGGQGDRPPLTSSDDLTDAQERAVKSVNDLIRGLREEAELLSFTASEREVLAATLRAENKLRGANLNLTDEQRDSIESFIQQRQALENQSVIDDLERENEQRERLIIAARGGAEEFNRVSDAIAAENAVLEQNIDLMSAQGQELFQAALAAAQLQRALGEVNRTVEAGATDALREYAKSATDLGTQAEGAVTNAFQGMEDALVTFVTTGKLEFSSLVDSMIADLIRLTLRAAVLGPLADAIAGAFNTGDSVSTRSPGEQHPGRTDTSSNQVSNTSNAITRSNFRPQASANQSTQVVINNNGEPVSGTAREETGRNGERRLIVELDKMVEGLVQGPSRSSRAILGLTGSRPALDTR